VKWERYGQQFLDVVVASLPRQNHHAGSYSDTVTATLELAAQGRPIAEIARERGLAASTIAGHIERLILDGRIDDVSPWLDASTLRRITDAAAGEQIGALGPLREALGESVSFDQLRLARAWLRR
jgi:ATP-dependent DNA helicase RecQ